MRVARGLMVSALLGCGGSLEPGDVAGPYRLTTVDAGALPYLIRATVECDEWITAGALTLTATGGFALRYDSETACSGAAALAGSREFAGVFSLDGRRILLNGAASDGLRASFEGQARGTGFVIVASDPAAQPAGELELGFEPSSERPAE